MGDEVRQVTGRFEPPPWEREAFEALARKRAEEQAAQDALSLAAGLPRPAGGEASKPAAAEPEPGDSVGVEAVPSVGKTAAQVLDERRVQAMLLELGRQEAGDDHSVKWIARLASVITAIVGGGMLVGGLMAIQRARGTTAGVMGSGALSVFGLCFMAMAVWVWVGSNRAKGSR